MELNKKTLRRIFLGIVGCILLYWVLTTPERITNIFSAVNKVISPFVVGAILAFVLNVPMRGIEKLLSGVKKPGLRRALAIVITILSVLLVLTGAVYLLAPQIAQTIETLVEKLPGFFAGIKDRAVDYLNENPDVMEWLSNNTAFDSINWSDLIQKAITWITGSLNNIVDLTITTVIGLGTGIFNGVLSLVFGLYCLSRKEILARQGRRLVYAFVPEQAADEAVRILRMSNSVFSNFISGQCLEALILGVMFAISMAIFKMPYIPLISVIIAITALVPIVGAFAGCAVGAFFILVDDPLLAVWFVVMFLVLQQIEGNLIYPRVVGSSIGLPGMWVLLAVAVGGSVSGVGGMLLMIPLMSVLYALAREITNKRLAKRGICDQKLQDHPPERRSQFKEQRKKNKLARVLNRQKGKL
ncbi:MAG: AI-2E family transporter [Oscillospiraceae bacterium]|nr:AI-2E family transporter [Oscillospiraceae bacterium]